MRGYRDSSIKNFVPNENFAFREIQGAKFANLDIFHIFKITLKGHFLSEQIHGFRKDHKMLRGRSLTTFLGVRQVHNILRDRTAHKI